MGLEPIFKYHSLNITIMISILIVNAGADVGDYVLRIHAHLWFILGVNDFVNFYVHEKIMKNWLCSRKRWPNSKCESTRYSTTHYLANSSPPNKSQVWMDPKFFVTLFPWAVFFRHTILHHLHNARVNCLIIIQTTAFFGQLPPQGLLSGWPICSFLQSSGLIKQFFCYPSAV